MFGVSLHKHGFFMHSRMRFSHVCAHLHVAACGSSEGFRWQAYRTFSASTPVPRPRCEGKCREGRYGSSPQDDSPRSIGLPPDQAKKTNQASGRISSVSTCAKEKNTRLIPQKKQADQANSGRQDHTGALRPSMHLHLFAQCIHACEHMLLIHPASLQTSPLTTTPLPCTAAAVSTRALSLAATLR